MITPSTREDEKGLSERSQTLKHPPPRHSRLRGDTTEVGSLLFPWLPGSSADSYLRPEIPQNA